MSYSYSTDDEYNWPTRDDHVSAEDDYMVEPNPPINCHCNVPALMMQAVLDDCPGKTVITCHNFDQLDYGCNLWECVPNCVPKSMWVAELTSKLESLTLGASDSRLDMSSYRGRRINGAPVCYCGLEAVLKTVDLADGNRQSMFACHWAYSNRNDEICSFKVWTGGEPKANWSAILAVQLKRSLDMEKAEHGLTLDALSAMEEECAKLKKQLSDMVSGSACLPHNIIQH